MRNIHDFVIEDSRARLIQAIYFGSPSAHSEMIIYTTHVLDATM